MMLLMLDLCAGLCGASQAMKERGWKVVTLDYDARFGCDITADVRKWNYTGSRPDLIWCSPPCDEFSREFMPWSKTGHEPDMSIALACKRIIDEAMPRYWVIENTKGAIRWFKPHLGNYKLNAGPFYLWGFFPAIGHIDMRRWKGKETYSSSAPEKRAMIPGNLSRALALAIERQSELALQVQP